MEQLRLQQGICQSFDVLVIGSGIAGLSYVLDLLQLKPDIKIALVTKKRVIDSNTRYAQGGIAAASFNEEAISTHVFDTLKAGDGLSAPSVVNKIISLGQQAIQRLSDYGVNFDGGVLGREGGHSCRRIYHVGDHTGLAIVDVLIKRVLEHPGVQVFDHHMAVNIINDSELEPRSCRKDKALGAYILNEKTSKIDVFVASVVVLATGGAGKIYQYTSNPDTATGDGVAMAYRAGVRVSNMEFYQFHPTLLYHESCSNFLISEALRGEGAYLRRPKDLARFMQDYAPKEMEMATRDIVARAIFREIDNSNDPFVYLDVRHLEPAFLEMRFPSIYFTLKNLAIDVSKDLIPVIPAAHYLCGGILSNEYGHTDIERLYAIGEVACTGLHGANRLASNSLLESVVTANLAAKDSLRYLVDDCKGQLLQCGSRLLWQSDNVSSKSRQSEIHAHWQSLRGEMTSYAGIIRNGDNMLKLLSLIKTRRDMIEAYYWHHIINTELIEARNLLLTAELVVSSALRRRASLGGHYRSDYPQKNNKVMMSFDKITH